MNVIECKEITKSYGRVKALDNLCCTIEENKITGLIGRNGAGKTTLLKIIAGHLRQTSGEVKVFSLEPFNNLTVSANIIFLHDQVNLPTALTLKEILQTTGSFYPNWNHELANRLFNYFSFHPFQYYHGLSKGMKSTFNMILGLSARCPLTLFDEPTTGMDAAVRKDFYRALLKDYIEHPRTIILSSHYLDEIEDLLEEILVLKEGKQLLHMPVAELQDWAMTVQGKAPVVKEWTNDKQIIYSKKVGDDQMLTVVKNDFSAKERQLSREVGIELSPVTTSDLCVYLTSKSTGGIDDVFGQHDDDGGH
ncbi:ABC transporter ATP-binding protein [Neobacillus dielmonensis]|uniref:ABC transporter ATP-binding protein n=1 Tax=Neobacillus dielmonensis TaxID=1347369 RepID=UPI0005A925B8|nr:ABC transporter ATP-binding protein [Neobacillus dielmonensis]